jgi:hypothetical protein
LRMLLMAATMAQVWDRLSFYALLDYEVRLKNAIDARLRAMFGLLNPYKLFDSSGRFQSVVDLRPDRPWEAEQRKAMDMEGGGDMK